MKVENREFKEKQIGNRYADVFLQAMKSSPTNGMTVGEMKDVSKLIDLIEAHKDDSIIEIKESQVKIILKKTREIKWVVYNKELIEMDDYLESLK